MQHRKTGANKRNRTADLFLTKEVLYQLSYVGLSTPMKGKEPLTHAPYSKQATGETCEGEPQTLPMLCFRAFQNPMFGKRKPRYSSEISLFCQQEEWRISILFTFYLTHGTPTCKIVQFRRRSPPPLDSYRKVRHTYSFVQPQRITVNQALNATMRGEPACP